MITRIDGDPAERSAAEDADTIAMELTPEQMEMLSRAAAVEQPQPSTLDPVPPPPAQEQAPGGDAGPRKQVRAERIVLFAGGVAVLGVLGGAAYLAATSEHPVRVAQDGAARTEAAPMTATDTVPVRFTNPFDASEVFEFPAGTSETEARDSVAELLLHRARDRVGASVDMPRRHGKKAMDNRQMAVAAKGSLAQRR